MDIKLCAEIWIHSPQKCVPFYEKIVLGSFCSENDVFSPQMALCCSSLSTPLHLVKKCIEWRNYNSVTENDLKFTSKRKRRNSCVRDHRSLFACLCECARVCVRVRVWFCVSAVRIHVVFSVALWNKQTNAPAPPRTPPLLSRLWLLFMLTIDRSIASCLK